MFYKGAWKALKHFHADMNVLVAVGTSAAYLYGFISLVSELAMGPMLV